MTAKAIRDRFRDEYHRAKLAIPTRDVEAVYVEQAKKGNKAALRMLVNKYIPFLYKMAKKLSDASYNLTEDEMVNAAVFGMQKAVDAFDPTLGIAFYTYYAPKAMNEMRKAGFESLLVHRPENQLKSKDVNKVSVATVDIEKHNDHELSIMDRLSGGIATDQETKDSEHKALVDEFMSLLLPTEHDVMSRLYLYDDDDVTLRSVGTDLGVSHERVRQLKASAIRRIHNTAKYNDMIAEQAYLHHEAI